MTERDWDAETAAALDEPEYPMDEQWHDDGPGESPSEGTYPEPNELMTPPLQVVVIGAADWDEPLLVQAALLGWARAHPERSIILWTTGAPFGAELDAREFAERSNWGVAEAAPERLLEVDSTVAFGFVSEGSIGASELAEDFGRRRPLRLLTLALVRPRTRWNTW